VGPLRLGPTPHPLDCSFRVKVSPRVVEREYRATTADLRDVLGVQRQLKKLGDSKIRARVRAGQMFEIDTQELDALTREHEQKKEQQHNLGLSRSRSRR
jgi:hypothetical protein